jgi:hypothetical protein
VEAFRQGVIAAFDLSRRQQADVDRGQARRVCDATGGHLDEIVELLNDRLDRRMLTPLARVLARAFQS